MSNLTTQFVCGPGFEAQAPQVSGLRNPEEWFFESVGGTESDSGERVNSRTAMGHVPVWQAINILAGDLGQLPFHKMKRDGEFTGKDREHELEFTFTKEPNPWQTPSSWKEMMMSWALGWGNAICWWRRWNGRRVLWPLHPRFTNYEEPSPGEYIITSRIDDKPIELRYDECFHIKGLSDDGFWGLAAVTVLKNAIGHGLALQKHGNEVFKNGGRPSGVVAFPESVSPGKDSPKNFRNEWNSIHRYPGEVALLWNGGKYTPISMSNEDAQWLEGRKLDRQFVASIFNIPAFKLNGDESSATRSNMEEQQRSYYTTSLSRWSNKFSEEAERKTLTERERRSGSHFFRWFPEAFFRGDLKSRSEAYGFAIRDRWLSPNEVRELEDRNPYDGGDEYLNPAIDVQRNNDSDGNEDNEGEAVTNLVHKQLVQLLATDANRIIKKAKTVRNFTNWVEDKYVPGVEEIVKSYLTEECKLALSLGVELDEDSLIEGYANQTKQALVKITETATKDELVQEVTALADKIRTLASELLNQMRTGAINNAA